MKIAKQKAVLHAHLGDCIYLMFSNKIKAYFEYDSTVWHAKGRKTGNGHDLPNFLGETGRAFGPHVRKVDVLSGNIKPRPEQCLPENKVVWLKDVIIRF